MDITYWFCFYFSIAGGLDGFLPRPLDVSTPGPCPADRHPEHVVVREPGIGEAQLPALIQAGEQAFVEGAPLPVAKADQVEGRGRGQLEVLARVHSVALTDWWMSSERR